MNYQWEESYDKVLSKHFGRDESRINAFNHPLIMAETISDIGASINPSLSQVERKAELTKSCRSLCDVMLKSTLKDGELLADPDIFASELLMLRRSFGEGGAFHGIKIPMPNAADSNILRLMPIIHLAIKEPSLIQFASGVQTLIASMDLFRPQRISEAITLHALLRKYDPSISFDEVLFDTRKNIHKHIISDHLPAIQSSGGIKFLIDNSSDIYEVLIRCGKAVDGIDTLTDFGVLYRLFKLTSDCVAHVEATSGISDVVGNIRSTMLDRVLSSLVLGNNARDPAWACLMTDSYRPGDELTLSHRHLVTLAQHLPAERFGPGSFKAVVVGHEDSLKSAISDACPESARHKVVRMLGLEHSYTRNELIAMQGHQFTGDLGL